MHLVRLVRQKERRWRRLGYGAAALTTAALVSSACAGPEGPSARSDDKGANGKAGTEMQAALALGPYRAPAARAVARAALEQRAEQVRRVATAQRWGLARAPLVPPLPPVVKPVLKTEKGWETETGGDRLPPVITRVPTKDKVVFLTMDDGSYKDPRLIRMMRDLDIPYSAFLTDQEAGDDYAYFRRMHRAGVAIESHTLTHPELRNLPYKRQYHEICGQQRRLTEEIGERPRLFRPPFGDYNGDSLLAAKRCGVEAVPLWQEEAFPDHIEYRRGSTRFHPGDIVLTHFRGREQWDGTMPDVVRRVLRKATKEGFAVARLEDYV